MRNVIEGESFSGFMKEAFSSLNFNWYVKLGYDREKHESRLMWEDIWTVTNTTPQEEPKKIQTGGQNCFAQWASEITADRPAGPGVNDYFWVEERRGEGQMVFHVLIADWSDSSDHWEY
jgi:hypothetical protein